MGFAPGIDITNAVFGPLGEAAKPGQLCVDWSVYLAADPATAAAYWLKIRDKWSGQKLDPWPSVGDAAFASPAFPQAIVLKGRSILEVTQFYLCGDAQDRLDPQLASQWVRKMVEVMVPRLP